MNEFESVKFHIFAIVNYVQNILLPTADMNRRGIGDLEQYVLLPNS